MSKRLAILLAFALGLVTPLAFAAPARAELEEIEVHGQIRIRGNLFAPGFGAQDGTVGFNDSKSDSDFYQALAEVNVSARMTDGVSGFMALRSFDTYGGFHNKGVAREMDDTNEDVGDSAFAGLRAVTFARFEDLAGEGNDLVGMYQAYIQIDREIASNLMVRLGRQEIVLGREYLLGNNSAGVNFSGRAFDALLAQYDDEDAFVVTAFTAKIFEFRTLEQDADVDLHAIYGTYYGLDAVDLDAYWIWFDNGFGNGVFGPAVPFGSDSENIHTIGGRVYGTALDDRLTYNVEAAYQFGDVNSTDVLAGGIGLGPVGTSLDVEAWTLNALVGYTFTDVTYTPEIHVEYAFFSGDQDGTDGDFEQFTRLFSDVHYGKINLGGNFDENMTNVHIIRAGGSIVPRERLTVSGDVLWYFLDEDGLNPAGAAGTGGFTLGNLQTAANGGADDDLGVELDLWATYQYSEDLAFSAGWSHFFIGDAVENAFSTTPAQAANDDLDYLWWEAHLVF